MRKLIRLVVGSALIIAAIQSISCSKSGEENSDTANSNTKTAPAARRASYITVLDPRFDPLFPAEAKLEKIADGYSWVEGPVWNRAERFLLFSDIPANSVFRWQSGKGATLFMKPSGYTGKAPFEGREPGSNGLAFDSEGRLVLCEHGDRRVARVEKDGAKKTLADRFEGKRLNSPNDLAFKSNGDLYFTDPPFGLPKAFEDPRRELPFCGVYRLTSDGKLTLLTKDIKAPNGIAFSPDEKTLYVTDVDQARPAWMAFDVLEDGTIANGRVFFDATGFARIRRGAPDGLKVDNQGNLFASGPGGLYVFAADGTHLGFIETGVATSNCAWGDDGSSLYICAGRAIYRIRTSTKGAGF
jgi:gluconolactonase